MRLNSIVFLMFASITFLGLACFSTNVEAQELRKALRDYRDERIFNYQPTDPQYRGKVFNIHTGHYGKFYNCDGEENKRNSPYICWKPHHEKDFPTRLGFCENLRRDIAEINQRLNDGAGACRQKNCNCNQCQQAAVVTQPSCSCVDCAANSQLQTRGNLVQRMAKSTVSKAASFRAAASKPAKLNLMRTSKTNCRCAECVGKTETACTAGTTQLSVKEAIRNASRDATRSFQSRSATGRGYGLVSGKILNGGNAAANPSAVSAADAQVAELAPIIETSASTQSVLRR